MEPVTIVVVFVLVVWAITRISVRRGWHVAIGLPAGVALFIVGQVMAFYLCFLGSLTVVRATSIPLFLSVFLFPVVGGLISVGLAACMPRTTRGGRMHAEEQALELELARACATVPCARCGRDNSVETRICPRCGDRPARRDASAH